jgi:hypothetical protein
MKKKAFSLVLTVLLTFSVVGTALAGGPNPGVYSKDSNVYGLTINQWTAVWWQYVMSFPASTNPLSNTTGADCADRQFGPVFFLVGTTGGLAVRDDCVVPANKSILFPIINVISAVPEDGSNASDLKAVVTAYMDTTDLVEASVDHVALKKLYKDYRFPSPIFSFYGATPGIFSPYYEGFRKIAFSDGWWVMLYPLSPGQHTIHFKGHLNSPIYGEFTTEVTYNLTVK